MHTLLYLRTYVHMYVGTEDQQIFLVLLLHETYVHTYVHTYVYKMILYNKSGDEKIVTI